MQVSGKLKALSHTVDALLQEIISRLEKEYDDNMIRQLLVLLTCARDGMTVLSLLYQCDNVLDTVEVAKSDIVYNLLNLRNTKSINCA